MTDQMIKVQKELDKAKRIFYWNKISLHILGLWPENFSNFRYYLCFGYFFYHMILEYLDLILFFGDLEHVVMNLTENLAFTPIVSRLIVLRLNFSKIKVLIIEFMQDYNILKFRNNEEKDIFIPYMATAKFFVKLIILNVSLTASSYFIKPLMGRLSANPSDNITLGYELPYRFYLLYEINSTQTYIWTYVSQIPFVTISFFGTTAADCLLVILVYHISGQMAILAFRINKLPTNECSDSLTEMQRETISLCTNYYIIIYFRMGKMIEESFSITLLVYLMCATIAICMLGFQILTNLDADKAILITFLVFMCLILLLLFATCTVGESLITESNKVYHAFYESKWYEMSYEKARCIVICTARSEKPLHLSAGDFGTFYLSTMTDVLRTSMGYLSVLRNFL